MSDDNFTLPQVLLNRDIALASASCQSIRFRIDVPAPACTSDDNSSLPRVLLSQDNPVSLVTQALGASESYPLTHINCILDIDAYTLIE